MIRAESSISQFQRGLNRYEAVTLYYVQWLGNSVQFGHHSILGDNGRHLHHKCTTVRVDVVQQDGQVRGNCMDHTMMP